MNIKKITNIVSWTLGLLGLLFLFILIFQGDDSIEANAMQGSYGFVSYMIWLAIIVLSVVTLSTLIFSLKNIASDKSKLKKFGMSIGSFLLVIVIAFVFSSCDASSTSCFCFIEFKVRLIRCSILVLSVGFYYFAHDFLSLNFFPI